PMFADLSGARGLLPSDWVVDSVPAAVERIRALAREPAWTTASSHARRTVRERFNHEDAGLAYNRVVLDAIDRR
ncbi:MAG: hypothetical protein WBG57_04575, partial [Ornithinimicrobium sp.]